MARGNEIVISSPRRGLDVAGYMKTGQTCKPGYILEIDATVDEINGLPTFKLAAPDADGGRPKGPLIIADIDFLQGKSTDDTYSAGSLVKGYVPVAGDLVNVVVKDVAGTADDLAKGSILIVDTGTGMLMLTTGTPETEPFMCMETVTDPAANSLVSAYYTGY